MKNNKVKIGNQTFELSEEKIKPGDLVYNLHAKKIDKCISIDPKGLMCVEFDSGNRAILSERNYKKAIKK